MRDFPETICSETTESPRPYTATFIVHFSIIVGSLVISALISSFAAAIFLCECDCLGPILLKLLSLLRSDWRRVIDLKPTQERLLWQVDQYPDA
ncbi:hypothetical protein LQW54_000845 [Pestalotiopsis sp. IQ-011]